jgi:hypothetical protein
MAEKIAALEERLQCAIEEAKRSVSPTYQTRRRPWAMSGAALAAGYLLGRIIFGGPRRRTQVVLPDDWPERMKEHQRQAGLMQTLSGMVSGVVTAVGVSLARQYANNLLSKRYGKEQGNGGNREVAFDDDRRYQ